MEWNAPFPIHFFNDAWVYFQIDFDADKGDESLNGDDFGPGSILSKKRKKQVQQIITFKVIRILIKWMKVSLQLAMLS